MIASCAAVSWSSTTEMPASEAGVHIVGDDEPRRLAVRGEEQLEPPLLKVGVGEHFRWQIEVIVALGGIECLTHRGRGVGHLLHLLDEPVETAVDGLQRVLHRRGGRDDRAELLHHLGHQRVDVAHAIDHLVHTVDHRGHVGLQRGHVVTERVDAVHGVERRTHRKAGRNVETVWLPVEVVTERPHLVIEIGDVIPHLVQGGLHGVHVSDAAMRGVDHAVGRADGGVHGGGELHHQRLHLRHRSDHRAHVITHLADVTDRSFKN